MVPNLCSLTPQQDGRWETCIHPATQPVSVATNSVYGLLDPSNRNLRRVALEKVFYFMQIGRTI
jgi:hypothetical protein